MNRLLPLLLAAGLASCAAPMAGDSTPPASAAKAVAQSQKTAPPQPPKPRKYPLKTCLVTGDDLDDFDDRVSTVHDGQLYEFCCKPCLKKFHRNPRKYAKALARAGE
jgi:YHS domain-containing protein